MNSIRILFEYIIYKICARHKRGYGIHSPFLYKFIREVLNSKPLPDQLKDIEELRKKLLRSNKTIKVHDLGAGSKKKSSDNRKVKDIVKHSGIKRKYGNLLLKIVDCFQPKTIIELGTSLGLASMYLSCYSETNVFTVEGCSETAGIARENFHSLKRDNIIQKTGNIDEVLPGLINEIQDFDLVYFDANHQKQATLNYFNLCLSKMHNNTIFIFDDIRWSKGMKEAWKEIKMNGKVSLTVDLFFMGIVFFKNELSKENYVIKF